MATKFLYLSEPDMLAAGVNDTTRCLEVCEEVFGLLAKGDYLMGGASHNSHGMGIVFPAETKFPNMPVAGPDRRFVAMPAYLGGRFDVCGNKWYGSNAANPARGLPRSVLTLMLNDKDTGEPLALMSANLLSAARTGAVPGVAAKYLCRKDARVLSMVGCGPINRSCAKNILTAVSGLSRVICYDLFLEKAKECADWIAEEFGTEVKAAERLEDVLGCADIVTVAASRLKPVEFQYDWLKQGATVLASGPLHPDEKFWQKSRIVFDHIGLHENYMEEAIASGDKAAYYASVIGGPVYTLMDERKLPSLQESDSIGQIICGQKKPRENDEQVITFIACGMSVFDVGWGYEIYQNALKKGLGQELLLWEEPSLK